MLLLQILILIRQMNKMSQQKNRLEAISILQFKHVSLSNESIYP